MIDGKIYLPLRGAASSHIIKPALPHFAGIVHNEHYCLEMASMIGIASVASEVRRAGSIEYLITKRYDRVAMAARTFQRVHQEDFCQALGIASERKYQHEGGPSLSQCFALIREYSTVPVVDIGYFLDAVLYHYLIGNCDAHGKNFSFIYAGKTIRLAPLYDSVATVAYPELSQQMAMRIGNTYERAEVTERDWQAFSTSCQLSEALVKERLQALREKLHTAMQSQKARVHPVIAKIHETVYTKKE